MLIHAVLNPMNTVSKLSFDIVDTLAVLAGERKWSDDRFLFNIEAYTIIVDIPSVKAVKRGPRGLKKERRLHSVNRRMIEL